MPTPWQLRETTWPNVTRSGWSASLPVIARFDPAGTACESVSVLTPSHAVTLVFHGTCGPHTHCPTAHAEPLPGTVVTPVSTFDPVDVPTPVTIHWSPWTLVPLLPVPLFASVPMMVPSKPA